ncbi:MAG: hypothetical protein QW175_05720 [Candidatus Bathyarchaeia archaeon]
MKPEVLNAISLVAEAYKPKLLAMANVTGVGVGYKKVKGVKTNIPAIIVFVSKKLPVNKLAPKDVIPPTIEGIPTDVVEAEFTALSQSRLQRIRPSVGGISVGRYILIDETERPIAGTLTNGMINYQTGQKVIASNNHVLADCMPYGRANVGDNIYQPSPIDGGTSNDIIATLAKWEPFKPYGNVIDGAYANPLNQDDVSLSHFDFGYMNGKPYIKPTLGMTVQKGGRTTGLTEGQVTAVNATVRVGGYRGVSVEFVGQVIIESETIVVQPGDSGSLCVEKESKNPCGVLFAGSSYGTMAVLCDFLRFSSILRIGFLPVVYGKVVDEKGEPIPSAILTIKEIGVESFTGDDGLFFIGNLGYGRKLTLSILKPGYKVYTTEIETNMDYIDLGVIKLERLPPPQPSLSTILSDATCAITFMALFTFYVAPEIISKVKEALEVQP